MTKIRVSGPGSRIVLLGGPGGDSERTERPSNHRPPAAESFLPADDDVPF
jgi:hypothetical protein